MRHGLICIILLHLRTRVLTLINILTLYLINCIGFGICAEVLPVFPVAVQPLFLIQLTITLKYLLASVGGCAHLILFHIGGIATSVTIHFLALARPLLISNLALLLFIRKITRWIQYIVKQLSCKIHSIGLTQLYETDGRRLRHVLQVAIELELDVIKS